jgi:hypothetical protein
MLQPLYLFAVGSVFILCSLLVPITAFAQSLFTRTVDFPVGNLPSQVAVGDFNRDGKLDLVLVNRTDNTVSVLLNTTKPGDTTPSFATQATFPVGTNPQSVAVADFNGDGLPDLVVTNSGDGTVSVLLNTTKPGDTTPSFATQVTFPVGTNPQSVAVADFNGDGRTDLVVTNSGTAASPGATVSVLLNTTVPGATTPSFATQETFTVGANPQSVAVADFNGDGLPDLVVTNSGTAASPGNTVSVLLNKTAPGASTALFATQVTFTVGTNPQSVAVADFNGDGQPDLVVTNSGTAASPGNTVSVLLNTTNPGANTPSFATQVTFPVGTNPQSAAVADFNGDGLPDLVVTNSGTATSPGNTVSVLLNTTVPGANTPSFSIQQPFGVGAGPFGIAVADFNGDHKPDLATTNANQNTVSVLLNSVPRINPSRNGLSLTLQKTFDVGNNPQSVAVADFNRDGQPDVVVATAPHNSNGPTNSNGAVRVLLNTTVFGAATPSFAGQQSFPVGVNPQSVAVADFNGDGLPDLVVTNFGTQSSAGTTVSVLLNTTQPNANTSFATQVTFPVGTNPQSVAVADFNGDGLPDLVVTNSAENTVSVLLNTTAPGAATPSFATQITFPVGTNPLSVAVADFNGDGLPDLVVTNSGTAASPGKTVSVLLNTGAPGATTPSFAPQVTFPVGTNPQSVAVADFNGDNKDDLAVVANQGGNQNLGVLLNLGGTTTAVVSSLVSPTSFGQPISFTATIAKAPSASQNNTPSGSVQFQDNGVNLGTTVPLSNGVGSSGDITLPVGTHIVSGFYSGDREFWANTIIPIAQEVDQAATTTTVTSSPNPSVFGQSVTFTATVTNTTSGSMAAPTGTVQFLLDGNTANPITATLTAVNSTTSTATATTTALTVTVAGSPHTVMANYVNADGNFQNSTGTLSGGQKVINSTTTTVASSLNPSVFGQSVTFTATVTTSGSTAAPTGTVQFVVDGNTANPITATLVLGTGASTATATTTTLTAAGSPHTVVANYVNADGNFGNSSSSALSQTVTPDSTGTTVASSQTPSVFGQSVTFTATVSNTTTGSTAAPTGTVQFVVDGNTANPITATLTPGTGITSTATATTAALTVAGSPHTVLANYVNADGNFQNTNGTLSGGQTVTAAGTGTTVASSPNPSVFGQSVTFTATVSNTTTGSTAAPTGTVQFVVDGNTANPITATLTPGNGASTATATTAALTVAGSPHTVMANYVNADGNFQSITGTLSGGQTVTAAGTGTTVASSSNPSVFGQPVTFTATVSNTTSGSTAAPTGTVQFVVDGNTANPITATLTPATGKKSTATATTTTLTVAGSPHTVVANYVNADGNFQNTTGTLSGGQTVTAAGTGTTVASSSNPSQLTLSVTFTATVSNTTNGSTAAPTGTVQFVVDGNTANPITATLTPGTGATSTATATTAALTVAGSPHTVVANYVNADGNFQNSNDTLSGGQKINPDSTGTTVASSQNGSTVGQSVAFTAIVTNSTNGSTLGAPTGTVQFKVDGAPFGNNPVMLTVGTGNSSTAVSQNTTTLSAGSHIVVAIYTPSNENFSNSDNMLQDFSQTVSKAHLTVTAGNNLKTHDGTAFSCQVTPSPCTVTISGFVNGDTAAVVTGSADFTVTPSPTVAAGTYAITPTVGSLKAANYDFPPGNFIPGTLTITKAASASSVGAQETPINDPTNGSTFTFTIAVTPQIGGTPTGNVTFSDSVTSTVLGTAPLGGCTGVKPIPPANAVCATFTTTPGQLSPAAHTITATYSGDVNFQASLSADAITIVPAIQTSPGQIINPLDIHFNSSGTTNALNVQCRIESTVPVTQAFPTCSLSSNSLTLPGDVTVTISTVNSSAAATPPRFAPAISAFGILGFVTLAGFGRRRRKLLIWMGLMTVLFVLFLASGCGGGFNNPSGQRPPGVGGTQAGTYLVSVTGTDSGKTVAVATIPVRVGI